MNVLKRAVSHLALYIDNNYLANLLSGAMDSFARGLKCAARIIEDGTLSSLVQVSRILDSLKVVHPLQPYSSLLPLLAPNLVLFTVTGNKSNQLSKRDSIR